MLLSQISVSLSTLRFWDPFPPSLLLSVLCFELMRIEHGMKWNGTHRKRWPQFSSFSFTIKQRPKHLDSKVNMREKIIEKKCKEGEKLFEWGRMRMCCRYIGMQESPTEVCTKYALWIVFLFLFICLFLLLSLARCVSIYLVFLLLPSTFLFFSRCCCCCFSVILSALFFQNKMNKM